MCHYFYFREQGRGKGIRKDKKIYSPEIRSSKELQKENVLNLKTNVRENRVSYNIIYFKLIVTTLFSMRIVFLTYIICF